MSDNPSPHGTVSGPPPLPSDAARGDAAWDGDRQVMTRTSEILRRSIAARATERITVAALLAALGDRAFGLVIVLLVLPTLIPGPPIPFYSLPFAAAIALVASQLARGFVRPLLPDWLLRRSVGRARLERLLLHAMPAIRRFERFAHTRPSGWTTPRGERWIGALCIAVALALAMPMPFGNTPPGLALLVLGLGLIERDSRLLAIGALAGIASVVYVGVLTAMAVLAAGLLFGAAPPLLDLLPA
jgi:hypothetical protein